MLYFPPSPYQGRGSRVPPPDAVGGPWSPLRRRVRRHTALGAVAFRATAEAAGTTRASPPKPGLCQTREGTRFRSAENPPAGARPAVDFSPTEGDSDGPKLRRAVSGPSPSSARSGDRTFVRGAEGRAFMRRSEDRTFMRRSGDRTSLRRSEDRTSLRRSRKNRACPRRSVDRAGPRGFGPHDLAQVRGPHVLVPSRMSAI